jgi:hypothetical protein
VTSSTEKTPKQGISRRTVVRGTAWAAPAVAIATAVPAYAGASQGTLYVSGAGCKLPGNSSDTFKGYAFLLSAQNTTATTQIVKILSVTLDGTDLGATKIINLDTCTQISAGSLFILGPNTSLPNLVLLTQNFVNSQNGSLVVTYQVSTDGGATFGPSQTTGGTVSAPPTQGNSCTSFTPSQKTCILNFV